MLSISGSTSSLVAEKLFNVERALCSTSLMSGLLVLCGFLLGHI